MGRVFIEDLRAERTQYLQNINRKTLHNEYAQRTTVVVFMRPFRASNKPKRQAKTVAVHDRKMRARTSVTSRTVASGSSQRMRSRTLRKLFLSVVLHS